jgi:hypothetical protein
VRSVELERLTARAGTRMKLSPGSRPRKRRGVCNDTMLAEPGS